MYLYRIPAKMQDHCLCICRSRLIPGSSDFASESLCKVTVRTEPLCILLLAAPVIVRTNVRTGN